MSTEDRQGGSTGRGRQLFLNLFLMAATTVICLVVAEVVLRVLYPPEPVFIGEHPQFGFANIPGKSGHWLRETETPVLVEINSKGLRDLERSYAKAPGTLRVLMLGDSFIGAFNTPFEQIASRQLERILSEAEPGAPIEVINAGTQGWGTAQELIFLREEGLRYEPDLVVLNFFVGNDFWNNCERTAAPTKPRYSVEEGELRFHPPRSVEAVAEIRDSVLSRLALTRVLRRNLVGVLGIGRTMARLGLVSSDGNASLDPETVAEMQTVACLLVEAMAAEVAAAGADFFVHLVPNGRDLVEFMPAAGRPEVPRSSEHSQRVRTSLNESLMECLEDRGIPVIFGWERMLADTRQGRVLFAEGIGHWTTEGNRRAAEDVAAAILPALRQRSGAAAPPGDEVRSRPRGMPQPASPVDR